jgi:hypothetical protein
MSDLLEKLKVELSEPSNNKYQLVNLSSILNYHISTGVLFLLSFFGGIFLTIASLAAVIFTPYLIYVLILEKKIWWIVGFIIIVIFPILLALIFFKQYFTFALIISLACFYFYSFLLRLSVNGWIKEYNWRQQLPIDKIKKEDDNDQFNLKLNH